MHRFIGDFNLDKTHLKIHDEDIAHQLRKVLRMAPGDKIKLVDGKGVEAVCEIEKLTGNFISVTVEDKKKVPRQHDCKTILYSSILKRDRFEYIVQKTTELGIHKIVPFISKRTVKLNTRLKRLNRIMKEAAEQSGRTYLPEIDEAIKFKEAVTQAQKHDINLFFDMNGDQINSVAKQLKSAETIGLFIGPEGGWNDKEIKTAKKNNFPMINISPFTLRAETAAVAATFLVLHSIKDNN